MEWLAVIYMMMMACLNVYLGCVSSRRGGLHLRTTASESPPQLPSKRHKEDRHCAEETHPQGLPLIPNQSHKYYTY